MELVKEPRQPARMLTCSTLSRAGAPHAFLTRHGSAARLEPSGSAEFQVQQVHGSTVVTLQADSVPTEVRRLEADALIATAPGQRVCVRTADCVPILVFDPLRNVAAAIHAGWRGAACGIVGATLKLLVEAQRCEPSSLLVAVGPAIGPCHFEVGTEVARHFDSIPGAVVRTLGERPHVDLRRVVIRSLAAGGVTQISGTTDCTYCERQLYHSFRRDGADAGRQLSIIGTRASDGV